MNPGASRQSCTHWAARPAARAGALLALVACGSGWAQSAPEAPAAPTQMPVSVTPVFAIKAFKISGDNPLGDGDVSRILAPFLRADATIDTLQKATAALEQGLREKGFGLHRVALPPQDIGDTVTLDIVKFAIGKVTLEGRSRYDEANIRRSLPELREGTSPNFKRLAVQTTIANENPGKQVNVALKESEEADKIDATVQVKESAPWSLSAGLANTGAPSSGRDRLTVSGGYSNLFNLDHQFVGAYTTSIERTNDVKQLGLSYRAPLYALNSIVGLSYTRSDVVGNFGTFSSTGAGQTFGINLAWYLPPDGGYRAYLSFGLDDKLFNTAKINGIPNPAQLDRRSRPVTVSYIARNESDTSFWGYNTDLVVNTNGGRGNDLASYLTEDPRISTARWTALRAGGNYTAPFASNWLWGVRGLMQYSPQALISGEQFGLGGVSTIRGTSERPISGDRGVLTSIEVTTPEVAPGLRFLTFVDAGWVTNVNPNGTTKPASDRLASAGLGLRYSHPAGVSLTADYGRIFNGSVVPLSINSVAPQKGDQKLHLNLLVRF
jgi:hemolysin activation/secretion protein